MDLSAKLDDLINHLDTFEPNPEETPVFIGLDGYIDKIQKVVQSQDGQSRVYYPTIDAFAERIARAAGLSAQLELVSQEVKLGGNAPIMAHALASLGVSNYCLGNFGSPAIDPLFEQIHSQSKLISLGAPAETNALEFEDGKLILSEVSPFQPIDWNFVKETVGLANLAQYCNSAKFIALVDWCNLPLATDVWRGIAQELVPQLTNAPRHFFFDLADPTKKSQVAIEEVLEVIGSFNKYGTVTLGLNENEARRLAQAIETQTGKSAGEDLTEVCLFIYDHTNLTNLLVHPLNRSIIVSPQGIQSIPGRVVAKPRISTGGGDNLNAGFCFGQLVGYSLEDSALLGMATSGAYVQNGKSPSRSELIFYLQNWKNNL
ncbi:MAG: hypothetical protein AAF944_25570 [Bacteroidota bacterium]